MEPTGDLGQLMAWWNIHGRPGRPQVTWLTDSPTVSAAENNVDRAVDEGATLIVVQARGDSLSARATIAEITKKSPTDVRGIEDGLSDIEWMREVATIRDLRAAGKPPTHEVLAASAALERAQQRSIPVVFFGLTAHAGALMVDNITDLFLPASSSTDNAIAVAQEFLGLRPALDFRLTSEDEHGPRAVVTLLESLHED